MLYDTNIYFIILIPYQHIISLVNKYFLSTYHILGSVKNSERNRQGPCPHETYSLDCADQKIW